jgi:hypothetical protein
MIVAITAASSSSLLFGEAQPLSWVSDSILLTWYLARLSKYITSQNNPITSAKIVQGFVKKAIINLTGVPLECADYEGQPDYRPRSEDDGSDSES